MINYSVTVLAGGVGGAKLALGLQQVLAPGRLTVLGNTGDDVIRHGLRICPDLDIVTYTLAGVVDPTQGWGWRDETFHTLDSLKRLGEETWFRLGDRDLATHIVRTARLARGERLTDVTAYMAKTLGVPGHILPPSDERVETRVTTSADEMSFEEFYVREQCRPDVRGVAYVGADAARATPEALAAIQGAQTLIIAPSNPVASIGPILAVPGIASAIANAKAPRIAVSGIVGGHALKGPADRMMAARGWRADAVGVAQAYLGLIDALVIDTVDVERKSEIESLGIKVLVTDTIMRTDQDKARLAQEILEWATLPGAPVRSS